MIFLDTSGVLAVADDTDIFHDRARMMFDLAEESEEEILMHNYVVVEAAALLQRKLSSGSSLKFLKDCSLFTVIWIDSDRHAQAIDYLTEHGTSRLSFVDVVSFLVMRSIDITHFIGFDKHFTEAGFVQYGLENT